MSRTAFSAIFCLAFIISANSAAVEQKKCPDTCLAVYMPVCATDGKTYKEYSNSCVLGIENCNLQNRGLEALSITDDVWCKTSCVKNLNKKLGNKGKAECLKACPSIYLPVCIANDKYRSTISSACEIDIYNCLLETKDTTKFFRIIKKDKC